MSHRKERDEKICLNCLSELNGRFCHKCGQENVETKETFRHLVTHFVYDITHFDSKFFNSVKYLLFKPGFLSLEYIRGRRVRYLDPIKMYVFTSAFFFLFFFSFVVSDKPIKNKEANRTYTYAKALEDIQDEKNDFKKAAQNPNLPASLRSALDSQLVKLDEDLERLKNDTSDLKNLNIYKGSSVDPDDKFRNVAEYDSLQTSLPAEKRDGWFKQKFRRKKNRYSGKI